MNRSESQSQHYPPQAMITVSLSQKLLAMHNGGEKTPSKAFGIDPYFVQPTALITAPEQDKLMSCIIQPQVVTVGSLSYLVGPKSPTIRC